MTLDASSYLLTGRIAVVTGAARGIGRATALGCARLGADVAACDREEPDLDAVRREVEALGRRCVAARLDVREVPEVERFAARVSRDLGPCDLLVNNVGGGFRSTVAELSPGGLEALVAENFTSAVAVVRAFTPRMRPPPRGGAIVNVTSIEAHRAAPGYAVYAAMKAALANLTKSLALELGERMIRVSCVAPDVIPTPGVGGALAVTTPLPVAGHADDVAAAVCYLGSDAGRFVTGVTLHVDGGNLAAGGWRRDEGGAFTT